MFGSCGIESAIRDGANYPPNHRVLAELSVGPISPGRHVIEARVESAGGNWAIPAASPDTPVPDGLTVTEWW